MTSPRPVVRVAVPVPLADAFDYLPPAGAPAGELPPLGSRVRVPFGRGERIGVVVEHAAASALAPAKLKPIREVLDAAPTIGAELLQTLRWAADYYHYPVGEVLSHALPSLLREGRAVDEPPEDVWHLTEKGRAQSLDEIARRAKQQARVLAALRESDAGQTELRSAGISLDTLERLADKGWIESRAGGAPSSSAAASAMASVARTLPALTAEQKRRAVRDLGGARFGLSRVSAAWRHGQRQDGDLFAVDRERACREPSNAAARPRDRPHAAARRTTQRALRRGARPAAFGAHGARTVRRVAARSSAGREGRRRDALGRVRSAAGRGPRDRRRRARLLL